MKKILLAVCAVTACVGLSACVQIPSGTEVTQPDGVFLTFDADGGMFETGESSLYSAAGKAADELDELGAPRKSGNAFCGWFNGNTEYSPNAVYDASQPFTAKYISGETDTVYDVLFDENSTVSVKLDMPDAQWKKLDSDFDRNQKSPIYRMADWVEITIDDGENSYSYWYDEVGVRLKGNTSRRKFYGDDGFYASVHYKLSFGETFDDEDEYTESERKEWQSKEERKARKNRTFGGMEKIDLKYNSTGDETYSKDLYAMKAFRDNGIVAPHGTLCALSALNKDRDHKNLGLYKLYEAVDSVFIARMFPNDPDGDLYKCSWGSGSGADLTNANGTIGIEDELNYMFYTYDKKTNKKVVDNDGNRDFSKMKNFIEAVNNNNADFDSLIDTDYFAMFEAVNYILGNPDCIRNHANNYYIYFRSDGKAVFIPYDYDRCLGLTSWDPTGNGCTELAPYTRQTTISEYGNSQTNPLYKYLIDKGAPTGDGSVLKRYRANLLSLSGNVNKTFDVNSFERFEENLRNKYSSYTSGAIETNAMTFDEHTDNLSFTEYITRKFKTLKDNIDNYKA